METNPYPLRTMNHKHHAVLMWIVANPTRYLYECARDLGYTNEWVRRLASTDLFQDELAKARESVMSEATERLRERVMNVAGEATESMQEKLEERKVDLTDPDKTVRVASERFVIDAANTTLRALGYINGNAPTQGAVTNIQINLDPEKVEAAREKLRVSAEGGETASDIGASL